MKKYTQQKGFSLIEMLVYVAVLSVIFLVVVNTILSFSTSYKTLTADRIIEHSAMTSLERLTRDIRGATSVDTGNSTFSTNPGTLTIITTNKGVSTTTKYYVSNNTMKVDVNGSYLGPLTTSGVSVTNLMYTYLSGSTTSAIKIDMTLQGTSGNYTKSKTYQTTVVLKQS